MKPQFINRKMRDFSRHTANKKEPKETSGNTHVALKSLAVVDEGTERTTHRLGLPDVNRVVPRRSRASNVVEVGQCLPSTVANVTTNHTLGEFSFIDINTSC